MSSEHELENQLSRRAVRVAACTTPESTAAACSLLLGNAGDALERARTLLRHTRNKGNEDTRAWEDQLCAVAETVDALAYDMQQATRKEPTL